MFMILSFLEAIWIFEISSFAEAARKSHFRSNQRLKSTFLLNIPFLCRSRRQSKSVYILGWSGCRFLGFAPAQVKLRYDSPTARSRKRRHSKKRRRQQLRGDHWRRRQPLSQLSTPYWRGMQTTLTMRRDTSAPNAHRWIF